jgi:hypothetical protein
LSINPGGRGTQFCYLTDALLDVFEVVDHGLPEVVHNVDERFGQVKYDSAKQCQFLLRNVYAQPGRLFFVG